MQLYELIGKVLGVDWSHEFECGTSVDPYMVWADQTLLAGFGGVDVVAGFGSKWPVLIELVPKPDGGRYVLLDQFGIATPAGVILNEVEIPSAYKEVHLPPRTLLASRFFTARIAPSSLPLLLRNPLVKRVQLGVPRIPSTQSVPRELVTPATEVTLVPRTVIGIVDDGCAFAHAAMCDARGTTRVHYLWDQARRLKHALWAAEDISFGYGAELRFDTLSMASRLAVTERDELQPYRQVDYAPVRQQVDGRGSQFSLDDGTRLPDQAMRANAHGTSTMFLAAGQFEPMRTPHPLDAQYALAETKPARADHASEWPVVFVQLPTRTVLDTSGGSLGVHVLDGVRYIIERARTLPYTKPGEPFSGSRDGAASLKPIYTANRVIINVSFGALAGCHDGTSIVELALADLMSGEGGKPEHNVWITLSAGNGHLSRTHAELKLPLGKPGTLLWRVGPDNPHESFLEVWVPDVDVTGRPYPEAIGEIGLALTPPGGARSSTLRVGQGQMFLSADLQNQPIAAAIFPRRVAQGTRGTMVLLAVARTRTEATGESLPGATAPHGEWLVEVFHGHVAVGESSDPGPHARAIAIHAWTERNDLLYGNLRAQQSSVTAEVAVPDPSEYTSESKAYIANPSLARIPDAANPLLPRYSLGSLSGLSMKRERRTRQGIVPVPFYQAESGSRSRGQVVVVGAYRLADGEMSPYSSGGPARDSDPVFGQGQHLMPSEALAVYRQAISEPALAPDVDAPADVGTALRGLRTVGTRSGSFARLSGTSAAAPLAARAIAEAQYSMLSALGETYDEEQESKATLAGGEGPDGAADVDQRPSARATLTPRADDRFRRGRKRLR